MKKYIILFCFWLSSLSIANAQIVAGEYFWDTDPGVGLAIALTAPEIASGAGDESFALNITTPSTAGQHVLFVRFKQNDTLWSQAYPQMLLVGSENLLTGSTTLVDSSKIVQVDYYWNDSTSNVHTVTLATPTDQFLSVANIGTSGLTGGQHILNIRVKDKYGLYSPYSKELVFISPENHLAGASDQVDSLEMKEMTYYWNTTTNPSQTILMPASDDNFTFTLNFPTAGAVKGANQLFFRFKDKYGFLSPWQSESILVMGRQSGELAKVDSIRYALSGYSYVGTPPNNFLNVSFNPADTLKRDSFDSDVIGSKEISTTGLAHGVHVMTFKVFGSTLLDSSIVSSKNSHFYQAVVRVDTTIKMQIGEPRLANNTLSNEFCLGGIIKIPIDTTGNWPRNNPAIQSTFTIKLSNSLGQNYVGISSTMNTTGDTLVGTLPNDIAIASGYKVMVESTLPMIRDTAATTLTIGLTLTPSANNTAPCELATLILGVNSNVPASYSWTGPAGFTATGNAPTRANIPANGGGTYTVNATSTLAGCTSSASLVITVNPLPVFTLGSNSPVCQGQNINLTSAGIGNSFLGWARGNINIGGSGGNKTVSAVTLADSGYYKVSYMSPASCIKTDSIKVIVKPLPVLSGISTNAPICSGNTLSFGLNASPGSTYSWTGPNSFISTTEDQSISSASTNASGTYSVAVTLNGCVVNTTIVNLVNQTPTANTTTPVVICENQSLSLAVNNTPSATYLWSGPFFAAAGQNPLVSNTATVGMSGTYSVTVTLGSCNASNTVAVTVKPLPILSEISTNAPICSGNTLTFGLNASPGSTYSWTGPNSFISTTEDQSISSASTNASGTYSVAVTLNGCVVNTTIVNVVNQTPTANTTSPVVICQNQPLSLAVNNTPLATYLWSGPFFASAGQNPLVSNTSTVGMSGTYSVTVTLGSCNASNIVAVTVKPLPVISGTNTNSPICSGNNLSFGIDVTAGSTYSWTGPNGYTSALEDPNISSAATNMSGTYSVTVSLNGCSVNTTVVNVVNLTPTVSTTSPVAICQGAALTLNVNNTPSATYGWSGPSSFSSILEDPLVSNTSTLGMSGTYSVTVSLGSCSTNGQVVVNINPKPLLVITNQSALQGGSVNLTLPVVIQGSTLPLGTTLGYFTDPGATTPVANATNITVAGTYYIKATTSSNCIDIKPVVVTICGGVFDPITASISSGTVSNVSTQKITATNIVSGVGTRATYRSTVYVELKPGFKAENGTIFKAEIGGCS
jgi:hypothetical protein